MKKKRRRSSGTVALWVAMGAVILIVLLVLWLTIAELWSGVGAAAV